MALSIIWTVMAVAAFIFSIMTGTAEDVSAAAMEGAAEAVTTALAMTGPLCLWCGICSLMEASGISSRLGRLMAPVLGRLFPEAQKDSQVLEAISGCVTANFLGLGNAATPLGIQAIKLMAAMQRDRFSPSDGMCRFIVLCTASIQLLPTTVCALRSSLGSESPFEILPAVWVSSIASVAVGLGMSWLLPRLGRRV